MLTLYNKVSLIHALIHINNEQRICCIMLANKKYSCSLLVMSAQIHYIILTDTTFDLNIVLVNVKN